MTKEEVEEEEVSRPTGSKKSPVRAFVLAPIVAIGRIGLLDGAGQFYNGDVAEGLGFMGLSLYCYSLISAGSKSPRKDPNEPRSHADDQIKVFLGVYLRGASYLWAAYDVHEFVEANASALIRQYRDGIVG